MGLLPIPSSSLLTDSHPDSPQCKILMPVRSGMCRCALADLKTNPELMTKPDTTSKNTHALECTCVKLLSTEQKASENKALVRSLSNLYQRNPFLSNGHKYTTTKGCIIANSYHVALTVQFKFSPPFVDKVTREPFRARNAIKDAKVEGTRTGGAEKLRREGGKGAIGQREWGGRKRLVLPEGAGVCTAVCAGSSCSG